MQSRPEIRILVDDLRIVANGSTGITRLFQQQGTIVECHQIVGLQLQDEVEVGDGTVVVTHLSTQQASVVVSKEVVGFEIECRIVVGHSTTQVLLVEAGQRTIDIKVGIFGQQVDSLVQIALSLLPFTTGQTDDSALGPDITIVGVELDTLFQRLDSLRRVFLLDIDIGLHGRDTGILAPTRAHRIQLGQRLVVFFLLDATQCTVVPQVDTLRIVAQGNIIVADGSLEILLVDTAESAQFVDANDIWVTLKCLRTVTLCSHVVVQIKFRHASEEPRLVEVWLGRNSLIEILDAQHIVLIIERRAPYHQQSVGIELSMTH